MDVGLGLRALTLATRQISMDRDQQGEESYESGDLGLRDRERGGKNKEEGNN